MLALAGGKGGCGKTTTALGLAAALARQGLDPLVVDADADMPDLHTRLGCERHPSLDAIAEGVPTAQVRQRVPALGGAAAIPAGDPASVGPALDRLSHPGPVLVDCPPGCGRAVAGPLRRADRAVLVTTDRPESIEDANKTERLATRLGARVVGAVVRTVSTAGGATTASEALTADVLTSLPTVPEPLTSARVRASHDRVATRLTAASKSPVESEVEAPYHPIS